MRKWRAEGQRKATEHSQPVQTPAFLSTRGIFHCLLWLVFRHQAVWNVSSPLLHRWLFRSSKTRTNTNRVLLYRYLMWCLKSTARWTHLGPSGWAWVNQCKGPRAAAAETVSRTESSAIPKNWSGPPYGIWACLLSSYNCMSQFLVVTLDTNSHWLCLLVEFCLTH